MYFSSINNRTLFIRFCDSGYQFNYYNKKDSYRMEKIDFGSEIINHMDENISRIIFVFIVILNYF